MNKKKVLLGALCIAVSLVLTTLFLLFAFGWKAATLFGIAYGTSALVVGIVLGAVYFIFDE